MQECIDVGCSGHRMGLSYSQQSLSAVTMALKPPLRAARGGMTMNTHQCL